jgi:hypothetical protein
MAAINEILRDLKDSIRQELSEVFTYDGHIGTTILESVNPSMILDLKLEILKVFKNYSFVDDRLISVYLYSIVWKVLEYEPQFVIDISEKAINDKAVKQKQPWIEILEDQNRLNEIATFFKNNIEYGDKYFQEKMLYNLSETKIDIGDNILRFLNSKEVILSLAAISVIESQEKQVYLPQLIELFSLTKDTDILLDLAKIMVQWDAKLSSLVRDKIKNLKEANADYYSDCIDELEEIISN